MATTRHYGEAFTESGEWGWQCFTCRYETTGYEDLDAAENDGDEHIRTASDA